MSTNRRNAVGANKRESALEDLVRQLSGAMKSTPEPAGLAARKSATGSIANQDYGKALRGCLSRWEVREIADEGKTRVWPGLNQKPVTLVAPDEFVRRWSAFGVDFKLASWSWKEGLSLLGFYVKKTNRLGKRPLIFVNTAHHPAIVGAALAHEMGHHLTFQIFASTEETADSLPLTGFNDHLTEPAELAADTLVSLAIFPAPIARTLFDGAKGGGAGKGLEGLPDLVFAKVLEDIANRYGLRFEQIRGTEKKLQALAALVHFTKLRRALWDEYHT